MIDPSLHPRSQKIIVGHNNLWSQFQSSNSFGLPLLFKGPKGIGKATLAYQIARLLFKKDSILNDIQMDVGSFPNLYVLEPTNDEDNGIPVSRVRSFIEKLRQRPALGGWRVVIFDSIDNLNTAGLNALLKIIEEPPHNMQFILISHSPSVLPTIASRCQSYTLSPLSSHDIQNAIPHHSNTFSAQFGSINQSMVFFNENVESLYEQLSDGMNRAERGDFSFLMPLMETMKDNQFDHAFFLIPYIVQKTAAQLSHRPLQWMEIAQFIDQSKNAYLDKKHVLATLFIMIERIYKQAA
jgi:replication-associated recombination protein RarA